MVGLHGIPVSLGSLSHLLMKNIATLLSVFLIGTLSQNVLSSKESPEGSCGRLCSCTEKDNMLYVNCEEKNIDSINDLQLEPGVFHALSFLKKLYINKNFLVALKEDTFLGLVNLEYLQADTNFIEVIEHGTFNRLIHLKIFLDDNPWDCTCDLVDFKQWVETLQKYSVSGSILCQTPNKIAKTKLEIVSQEVMCPDLVTFLPMPTGTFAHGVPFPSTTIKSTGFYHHFTVSTNQKANVSCAYLGISAETHACRCETCHSLMENRCTGQENW
uniref:SLIT and NTRK-like family, member 6 n=1 Tax=Paramormyrops kingsleyae TaxID=1676925 RepID=A0A3B3RXS3_9TELE